MADDSIRIEYNQDLKPLEALLSGVERAGDFFVSGAVEIPMPRVEVDGVGVLSFPVPPAQIAALIRQAVRAPYGRGAETILDEAVRRVWQLPPEKVRLGGKSWAASFEGILQRVIAGLGCEGMAVSAEFYKMLVYDAGGFFLAHRDTEKTGGMFGTLVVVLPSAHRGGALAIRHAGREVVVEMDSAEVSEAGFAAFYADCEHEVRPIAEGHRVCLVYNLIQQRGGKGRAGSLCAPDYEKQVAAAAKLLEKNLSASGAPVKIAWLLEHQYSPEGLSFAGLKSADAARVQVLAQAAERADCAAHLGIVHIEESGAAEENYGGYGGGYSDEDEEESDGGDFEIVEVCDWRHYVSEWRDSRDRAVQLGEIPVEPGEMLPDGALDGEKPDEQRLLEASGNEGASFERSYRRAALVLWRRERYAEVLLQAGVPAVLPHLRELIDSGAARKEAVALARRLVKAWKAAPPPPAYEEPPPPEKRDGMLMMLVDLGDAALLEKFIAAVVTCDFDGSENAALTGSAGLLGAEKTGALFSELVRRHTRVQHGHCVELICALSSGKKAPAKSEWRSALREIAGAAVEALDEIGIVRREAEWMEWRAPAKTRPVDAALVANLLDVLGDLDASALRAAAVEKFAARPEVFDPAGITVPALAMLREWDAAANRLWFHCAEFLLHRSARPPQSPADWRQEVKLSCACADCRELQAFTLDPAEKTHRFRTKKERRQHLHREIEKHALDMTHLTERTGSPQTLVCTKDRRSYQRRCDRYRRDIAALASLEKKSFRENEGARKRIATARALAAKWSPD